MSDGHSVKTSTNADRNGSRQRLHRSHSGIRGDFGQGGACISAAAACSKGAVKAVSRIATASSQDGKWNLRPAVPEFPS
ncbi:MAG: hypothetical protein WCE73_14595, partial [Candidatus Angelobacter sp.]